MTKNQQLNKFEDFREEWLQVMITYVINELELDNESAQFVRRDPVSCKVNYDTYKLLNFK